MEHDTTKIVKDLEIEPALHRGAVFEPWAAFERFLVDLGREGKYELVGVDFWVTVCGETDRDVGVFFVVELSPSRHQSFLTHSSSAENH